MYYIKKQILEEKRMKIIWENAQYGGSKLANLGHGFKLTAKYPITDKEGHRGYVNGLPIGQFKTQEECTEACEDIAIKIIKDLYKNYV